MGEAKRRKISDPNWGKSNLIHIFNPNSNRVLQVRPIEYFLVLKVLKTQKNKGNQLQFEYDYLFDSRLNYSENEQEFLVGIYENIIQHFLEMYLNEKIFNLSVDAKPLLKKQNILLNCHPFWWLFSSSKHDFAKADLSISHLLRSNEDSPTQ